MSTVLLTGWSGTLGQVLARRLMQAGYTVRAAVRRLPEPQEQADPCPEWVRWPGANGLTALCAGCDMVIHAAAETRQHLRHLDDYLPVNAELSEALLIAAEEAGVSTFVFISTTNTLPWDQAPPGSSLCFPFNRSPYAQSKAEAERRLMQRRSKIRLLFIHPGFILSESAGARSSGQLLHWLASGGIKPCPPGGKPFVQVDDVAEACLRAMAAGRHGEHFLAVAENLSYRAFFQRYRSVRNKAFLILPLPAWVWRTAGCIGEMLHRLGFRTAVNKTNMEILCTRNYYAEASAQTAVRLGMIWQPVLSFSVNPASGGGAVAAKNVPCGAAQHHGKD